MILRTFGVATLLLLASAVDVARAAQQLLPKEQPNIGSSGSEEEDLLVQDILAQSKLLFQAIIKKDISYLDRHIASEARFKTPQKTFTKLMLLAAIMEQPERPAPVKIRYSTVSTKPLDGAVIEITTTSTLSIQASSGWIDYFEERSTSTVKKVDGEWIVLAGTTEYAKPLVDLRRLSFNNTAPSQTSAPTATSPCSGIEMMGLFKNEIFDRAMGGGVVEWLAKIRNNTSVAKIVVFSWIDQYGQQQRAQVQLLGGGIASPRLDLTQARYISPVRDLRIVSCQ